ncbi:MAG: 2-aminoethylphosphonate--pyruvate transaminase [Clostridium sp.]
MINLIPDNKYILLTPGPLSTSKRVRAALLNDWCTWDKEYNKMVQDIRSKLLNIGMASPRKYTTVLMQGSGSFGVESVIGSVVGKNHKLLILVNGAYGKRIGDIAEVVGVNHEVMTWKEKEIINKDEVEAKLKEDLEITHVAFVHCETTTGILNPLEDICKVIKKYNKTLILDAMSSFGGIKIDIENLEIDYLISSANKCIQGVPGFSFIIANKVDLISSKGEAKSLALDIYEQWDTMENNCGKWRFTSPTHTVHAFYEAIKELEEEGGVEKRYERYNSMQKILVQTMDNLGFEAYVNKEYHSPIITTFRFLENNNFTFNGFYDFLKTKGFVIYPGKLSDADTFRIGNIGHININDIERLLVGIREYVEA